MYWCVNFTIVLSICWFVCVGVFVCLCVGLFLWVCHCITKEKEDGGEEKKSEFVSEGEEREKKRAKLKNE